jgi:hypothetical protein
MLKRMVPLALLVAAAACAASPTAPSTATKTHAPAPSYDDGQVAGSGNRTGQFFGSGG